MLRTVGTIAVMFSLLSSIGFAQLNEYAVQDDQALVTAVSKKRPARFIEAGNLEVTKILPTDTRGNRHQKWMVRLSNGQQVQAVYNIDMCPEVPLQVGDRVGLGGELVMTKTGPLMHWLHHDPKDRRQDGYVELNGQFYCL